LDLECAVNCFDLQPTVQGLTMKLDETQSTESHAGFGRTELSMLEPTAGINAKPLLDADVRLAELNERVTQELRFLDYPAYPWVAQRYSHTGEHVWDVVVVGAGQGGLATTFGLRREKVDNVIALDRAPAGREGPWITYARMLTLRSPKHVTGPDLGIASLTPQAWYIAVYGQDAWDGLGKWSRVVWQDYLIWYRKVLDLPVRNETEVTSLSPEGDMVRVQGRDLGTGEELSWLARKVVLSTGIEGNGAWELPNMSFEGIPNDRFIHTNWEYDLELAVKGRRVAVLGAGASAFDTAATALEAGAAEVHQFIRRKRIPDVNPFRVMEQAGFLNHFGSMSTRRRLDWMLAIEKNVAPPTQDGVNRCTAFDNYKLSTGVSWKSLRMVGDEIEITTTDGDVVMCDFLILGTGCKVDLSKRPELRDFHQKIRLWRHSIGASEAEKASPVLDYPFLSGDLSFQEKEPGTAPFLKNIHNFTYIATASVGYSGASLTGMKYGIRRVIEGITSFLWLEDADHFLNEISVYSDRDLDTAALDDVIERTQRSRIPGSQAVGHTGLNKQ
jgi:cation diffusion facilitator CzcD-associated flavoprotein CzcO